MSDDHSKVVPLLPIPNRTVKRFCADDSAGSRVKVGHRQTLTASKYPLLKKFRWGFCVSGKWFFGFVVLSWIGSEDTDQAYLLIVLHFR